MRRDKKESFEKLSSYFVYIQQLCKKDTILVLNSFNLEYIQLFHFIQKNFHSFEYMNDEKINYHFFVNLLFSRLSITYKITTNALQGLKKLKIIRKKQPKTITIRCKIPSISFFISISSLNNVV